MPTSPRRGPTPRASPRNSFHQIFPCLLVVHYIACLIHGQTHMNEMLQNPSGRVSGRRVHRRRRRSLLEAVRRFSNGGRSKTLSRRRSHATPEKLAQAFSMLTAQAFSSAVPDCGSTALMVRTLVGT